jgi:unsaturated rhamnogalacturonyl hydrolase
MKNYKEPIEYAKQSCDTMMRKFTAQELPPKGHFHYHQGVFLERPVSVNDLHGVGAFLIMCAEVQQIL